MRLMATWDVFDFMEREVEYLKEYESLSEAEAREAVHNDPTLIEMWWEDFTEYLTELMKEVSKKNKYKNMWRVTVKNFGWRNRSGHKDIEAETGGEMLRSILPDTECKFKLYRDRNKLYIQNYHHDSPTGNEWYTIRPMTAKEIEG